MKPSWLLHSHCDCLHSDLQEILPRLLKLFSTAGHFAPTHSFHNFWNLLKTLICSYYFPVYNFCMLFPLSKVLNIFFVLTDTVQMKFVRTTESYRHRQIFTHPPFFFREITLSTVSQDASLQGTVSQKDMCW